jgi:hypothetical protein
MIKLLSKKGPERAVTAVGQVLADFKVKVSLCFFFSRRFVWTSMPQLN